MIVAYGTVCLDRTYRLPSLPKPDSYIEMLGEHVSLGGEAANTSAAIRYWGGEVVLVGNPIGSGLEADSISNLLLKHALHDAILPTSDHEAPVCHIIVTPNGERTMFGRGFVEMEERSDPSVAPMVPGGWFTADPNHGALARTALTAAHRGGMRTYALDFVLDQDRFPAGCFWQSSTSWVGTRGDLAANTQWLRDWLTLHDCTAILTDGGNGFLLGDRLKGVRHLPPWPIDGVIDTTGAGDVFRAGMLLGLDYSWPLDQCMAFASAASALNCRALGAIGGLKDRASIEELVRAHPGIRNLYAESV